MSLASGPSHVDRVVILKQKHELQLWGDGRLIKSYPVALGGTAVGAKHFQGDHKTPEGKYVIDARNEHSHYYKALHVSYPNAEDRAFAAREKRAPGGDIMIHGLPNGYGYLGKAHRMHDWTDGCVAVTNEEMDEIWKLVPVGTQVEIRP